MNYREIDKNISKFLSEWYNDDSLEILSLLKLSLSKEILSSMFQEYFKKKNKFYLGYRNFGGVIWTIKKAIWFFLWGLKWFLFLKIKKDKKVLLVALGSNIGSIDIYLKQVSEIADKNNCVIVSLNLIESFSYLKHHQLFYFPRFFYAKNQFANQAKINNFATNIFHSIQILKEKYNLHFSLNSKSLIRPIESLLIDYSAFSYLITKLILPNQIVGLIQDYDYTYNKLIYYKIANSNHIKTLAIDCSIPLYQHLYKKFFSDYHLIWGEYKKKFLLENNLISDKNIIEIGKPLKQKKSNKRLINNGNLWLYIAQSYSDPSMFLSSRDYFSFELNVKILSEFQKNNYPKDRFIIKNHPADKSANLYVQDIKSVYDSLDDLINKARIIFVEDSTLAIELYAKNLPIVYIYDALGNDNIGLANDGLIFGINTAKNFDLVIKNIFEKKEDFQSKNYKETLSYYFGNFVDNNFQIVIEEILFSDKSHQI
ncbi:MAG: hypothetical protein IT276_09320 [Ignavibacteriaceae bacterium]|nr:hypothetical protein [Ignavibacterium sp.]MCC6255103.1 hypothetical protein [Ignavibacteriaceae bacterium]HRN27575.1 hypothetical protein [Ignavibacteriaceae bacterium]HRP93045.1 hypothetical protein [Ignavibacteriaceae bacterium]